MRFVFKISPLTVRCRKQSRFFFVKNLALIRSIQYINLSLYLNINISETKAQRSSLFLQSRFIKNL